MQSAWSTRSRSVGTTVRHNYYVDRIANRVLRLGTTGSMEGGNIKGLPFESN